MLLTENAPPEARELFDRLFASETEEDMEFGFEDLRLLNEWYVEQARKADLALGREKPPVSSRAGESPATALEEWTAFVQHHNGVEPDEPDEADDEDDPE